MASVDFERKLLESLMSAVDAGVLISTKTDLRKQTSEVKTTELHLEVADRLFRHFEKNGLGMVRTGERLEHELGQIVGEAGCKLEPQVSLVFDGEEREFSSEKTTALLVRLPEIFRACKRLNVDCSKWEAFERDSVKNVQSILEQRMDAWKEMRRQCIERN